MPITVGSVGDIISICILIKDVVGCLNDSSGSSSEYHGLMRELWCLERALLEVQLLPLSSDKLPQIDAIKQTVQLCRLPIDDFLKKIRKHQKYLKEGGSGSIMKDMAHKVQWACLSRPELDKFRSIIEDHTSAINVLLMTAGLNLASLNDEGMHQRLEALQQHVKDSDDWNN